MQFEKHISNLIFLLNKKKEGGRFLGTLPIASPHGKPMDGLGFARAWS